MVVVASVMFGVRMPNSSSDLTDEVEPALLSQVPKIPSAAIRYLFAYIHPFSEQGTGN